MYTLLNHRARLGFLTLSNTTEVKQLKKLVRDIVEPGRNLGHVDRHEKTDESPPIDPTIKNHGNPGVTHATITHMGKAALSHDQAEAVSREETPISTTSSTPDVSNSVNRVEARRKEELATSDEACETCQ